MAFLIPENLKTKTEIPAAVRRVVSSLQVGLDDTCTVWYEPLFDPKGEKPHLVVLLPNRGIVILEVIEFQSTSGFSSNGIRVSGSGIQSMGSNLLVRADRLATLLRNRIKAELRLTGIKVPVEAGGAFPYQTAPEAKARGLDKVFRLEFSLFKAELDAAIDGSGEAALLRTFHRILGNDLVDGIPADTEKILRGLIQPDIVIDRVARTPKQAVQLAVFRPPDGDEDILRVMDRKQEALAKSLGSGHRVIRGVAGSGKTLILVYRARLLAEAFPQQRFLVTCFTNTLVGQLQALLGNHPNLEVRTLDSLMGSAIHQADLEFPGYQQDASGEQIAQVALQAVESGFGPRYHAVLLDEAQDFGTSALRFATKLLRPDRDDLVIVADAAQNIFRRKFNWRAAGIQAQGRARILKTNYRNTRQILDFASRFLLSSTTLRSDEVPDLEDENAVIPPESAVRDGEPPRLVIAPHVQSEIDKIIDQVLSWASAISSPRSIAVLYAGAFDSQVNRPATIVTKLKAAGLGVFLVPDGNNQEAKNAKRMLAYSSEPVVVCSVYNVKGLEFPRVVLCGLRDPKVSLEDNRKLLYVGMTRASDYLTVIATKGFPLLPDLEAAANQAVTQHPAQSSFWEEKSRPDSTHQRL